MRRCSGCFEQIADNLTACPVCGFVEGSFSGDSQFLVPGTVLSDMFVTGKVLKSDRTYVTYVGWHNVSNIRIAIKEYLPRELVARVPGSTFVMPSDSNREASYDEGFQAFVNEAKRIYKEGGDVLLYDCIAENNTAYMILEFTEKDRALLRVQGKAPTGVTVNTPDSTPVNPQVSSTASSTASAPKVQPPAPAKVFASEPLRNWEKKQDTAVPVSVSNENQGNGLAQKISLLPMWLKILVPVVLVGIVITILVISISSSGKKKKPATVESSVSSETALENIATSETQITEATTAQTSETTVETLPNAEWRLIDDKYYLYIDDEMATGWVSNEGHMYYLNPETGTMVIGWQEIDDSWYYFCKAGYIVTGWQQINDSWFYFNAGGSLMTGWQEIDGSWFYFDDDGKMLTDFQELEDNTYYFDPNGRMRIGWMKIDDEMYFFDKDGIMFTGTRIINGTTFEFDDDGRCLNPPD